ncbi:ABC transporter permease [Acidobacteria bacterium AB60]|nr:ABC transporter permease [Acidobacteria bacterium AB60]
MMNSLLQDVRYALRQLRKSPGFTITVVLTLALGIGANASIFTLFDQVLLRMLPVEKPKELVRFEWSGAFSGSMSSFGGEEADRHNIFSYPMYRDLRSQNQVFQGILASEETNLGISWNNQAEDRDAEVVSGNYFQLLGLSPAAGRLFSDRDETEKNANPVAVLSYDYWRTRFNADPAIVGQTLLVNGHPFTVVGVAPNHFDSAIGGFKPSLFVPVTMVEAAIPWRAPIDDLKNHQSVWMVLVARLKPGVTAAQAQASLAPLWHSLREYEYTLYKSKSERFRKAFIDSSHLKVVDDSKGFNPNRSTLEKPLVILFSMTGLLVAMCAINIATLLLLRATARAREMSMRYALGARRSRVISQLLVEGGTLGLTGAAAGLALAPVISRLLVRLITTADPGSEPYSASIDARVLMFTLALSVIASLLFSIAPVIHFMRPDLVNSLRQSAGTASKGSQRFRKFAVGLQIALSVMLLTGAGLFVRTLNNLRTQQLGFETSHLVTFALDPSNSGYGDDRTPQIITGALEALGRIPGVNSIGATTDPELVGDNETSNYSIQGYKPGEDERMNFEQPRITPGYFATLRQPLLAGREFTTGDAVGQPKVAVVNLAFAKRFFGSPQNAIGRQISEGGGDDVKYDITIVGVVGDIKHSDLRTPLGAAVYEPYFQAKHPHGVTIYLRTFGPPENVEGAVRTAIHQLDPTLVVDGLRTMEEQVDRSASDERALAFLAIGFAVLAMVLAAVGFYGVLAYSTEQRTREIGVRLALGAQRASVVVLISREMLLIASIATIFALPTAALIARLFRSQLFGVSAADPITLAAAVVLTAAMVVLASALPARRAASVQPMRALRVE